MANLNTNPSPAGRPQHDPAIDRAKGLAILGVLAIHASILAGSWFFDAVIARSVPLFLVLLGINGELWHRAHAGSARTWLWLRVRLTRLMVPFWVAAALFWVAASSFGGALPPFDLRVMAGLALGQIPWAPLFWFVAVAAQWIVLFPLLRLAFKRCGNPATLALAAAVTALSVVFQSEILWWMFSLSIAEPPSGGDGIWEVLYHFMVFGPAFAWHIAGGVWLARAQLPLSATQGGLALVTYALLLAGLAVAEPSSATQGIAQRLLDPLLLVGILGLASLPQGATALSRSLSWLGRESWFVYLGHAVVHSSLTAAGYDLGQENGALWRAGYFLALLGSGAAFAVGAKELRKALG